jgi:hypothetical protein
MTVGATLDLARSYGVEVRLNAAQDGLRLEFDEDPPQALVNVLRRAKWEIALLRRGRAGRRHLCPPVLRRRQRRRSRLLSAAVAGSRRG